MKAEMATLPRKVRVFAQPAASGAAIRIAQLAA
jgi:hypothetical protein